MIVLPADRLDDAQAHFAQAGYAVSRVSTPRGGGLRETQAQLAEALRLPTPAATNLDAMADLLRDLPDFWDGRSVALVWEGAGRLAQTDGRAWWLLAEILDGVDGLAVVALGPDEEPGR